MTRRTLQGAGFEQGDIMSSRRMRVFVAAVGALVLLSVASAVAADRYSP
jgi:hypothetical protein